MYSFWLLGFAWRIYKLLGDIYMKLKNIVLASIAVSSMVAASSAFAWSDLTTINQSSVASTVSLISPTGAEKCVTTIPGQANKYTPAGGTLHVPGIEVGSLCAAFSSSSNCTANIYMGPNHNCTGVVIAQAYLSPTSPTVRLTAKDQSRYTVSQDPSTYSLVLKNVASKK